MSDVTRPSIATSSRTATWPLLVGWFAAHVAVWMVLVKYVPGDDFIDFGDLGLIGTPWVRQFWIALLVVLAMQIAFVTWAGWWPQVLRDTPRSAPRWMYAPVALMFVVFVGMLIGRGIEDLPSSYWVGMTVTVALVGTTEELSFRGILLVGGRHLTDERMAWLVSSALFGLFHLPNAFFGQDIGPTIAQVFQTAILGSAFYCLRRVSGSIVVCIVFHAAWDWVILQSQAIP